jgi:hypothetical protein
VSPAPAAAALSLTLVLLTALLALSIAAVVRAEPWIPGPPEQEAAGQFSPPATMSEPPTAPLPRRVAGESGWVAGESGRAARAPGELSSPPGVIGRPGVSGSPPWDPAPKPPGTW